MESTRKRIDWVDTGKFFCIMFVMLSHLESGSAALEKFYQPFFLTMFFFLSGYVYRQPGSFREHMGKKARGLLVPWLIFGYGSILLTMVTPFVDKSDIPQRFLWALLQVRGFGDEVWFAVALFVSFIPFYFFAKWDKPGWACLTAFGLAQLSRMYSRYVPGAWFPWGTNALPWHLQMVFPNMLWMLLGYCFRLHGEAVFDRLDRWWSRGLVWAMYLGVLYGRAAALEELRRTPYLKETLGILAMICLCKAVKSNRYIRYVGANTLTYFALHGRAYEAIQILLRRFAAEVYGACLGNPWASSLLAVGITVVVSVMLMAPAEIINRWFPWVLGRKRTWKNAV